MLHLGVRGRVGRASPVQNVSAGGRRGGGGPLWLFLYLADAPIRFHSQTPERVSPSRSLRNDWGQTGVTRSLKVAIRLQQIRCWRRECIFKPPAVTNESFFFQESCSFLIRASWNVLKTNKRESKTNAPKRRAATNPASSNWDLMRLSYYIRLVCSELLFPGKTHWSQLSGSLWAWQQTHQVSAGYRKMTEFQDYRNIIYVNTFTVNICFNT